MLPAEEVLRFHPELREQLDEIVMQGWRYLYIQTTGTAVRELTAASSPFSMGMDMGRSESEGGRPHTIVTLDAGEAPVPIVSIPVVEEFRINISTKNYPRAATLDIAHGTVSFIHDPFWRWENGWGSDPKKVADALEVLDVAKWLMDVKKLELREPFTLARYVEARAAVEALRK